jgi:hypothetical protein
MPKTSQACSFCSLAPIGHAVTVGAARMPQAYKNIAAYAHQHESALYQTVAS